MMNFFSQGDIRRELGFLSYIRITGCFLFPLIFTTLVANSMHFD